MINHMSHEETMLKAREAYLNAIEAQLDSTHAIVVSNPRRPMWSQNDLAVKAAIDAERAAIAAYKESMGFK